MKNEKLEFSPSPGEVHLFPLLNASSADGTPETPHSKLLLTQKLLALKSHCSQLHEIALAILSII